jgi:hypothetical protein
LAQTRRLFSSAGSAGILPATSGVSRAGFSLDKTGSEKSIAERIVGAALRVFVIKALAPVPQPSKEIDNAKEWGGHGVPPQQIIPALITA